MADLSEQIEDAAGEPKRVTIDGQTAEGHPIKDLIEADRYLAQRTAAGRTGLPFRLARFRPPGASP